jgi:hypothetical protein
MNDCSGPSLLERAEKTGNSFRPTPELGEERGAITDVTATGTAELLTSSEQRLSRNSAASDSLEFQQLGPFHP